ncbi:hypothetical protein NDU88_007941 [Pleurodeles waltl]|uniref:Uncharacterized protein n=1 Tax=Pleurodeles waltl TaxID=8319 RepID=A0AAV7VU07_PLEWA|nr:hypothetical protein NDU88_007941 [Pleurodeles waltl]
MVTGQGVMKIISSPDADRTSPGGTAETVVPDLEELHAAAANLPGANAEGERVLKPVRTKRRGEAFSAGSEDGIVEERWANRWKQMPEEGRPQAETPRNLRVQLEEGDSEERQSAQTGHALGRAWPRQVRSEIQAGNGGKRGFGLIQKDTGILT